MTDIMSENLNEFLRFLVYDHCYTAKNILCILEKPWKWEKEYKLFRMSNEHNSPWLVECPNCCQTTRIEDTSKIDWLDGKTTIICGEHRGINWGSDDFCDSYLEVVV